MRLSIDRRSHERWREAVRNVGLATLGFGSDSSPRVAVLSRRENRTPHFRVRYANVARTMRDELEEATQDEVREAIERTEADDDDLVVGS